MADTRARTPREEPVAEQPVVSAPSVPTFPVRRLIAESGAFFGVAPHVVTGALYGRSGDDEMTVDEARQAIESWLAAPAKEG